MDCGGGCTGACGPKQGDRWTESVGLGEDVGIETLECKASEDSTFISESKGESRRGASPQ